ncbi:sugar transferase [Salsipaludibacter albus]|uniref:sugar transferase n=1 Tax=Salsipaludibacter albus TaxID=2849650 RepID=UPI001EE49885|nr:sugar transferase [Salsipaludibacter albus]MBY5161751.1 sugar transferase [Salsipaludibacter albus]
MSAGLEISGPGAVPIITPADVVAGREVARPAAGRVGHVAKRLMDVVLASVALVLGAPVFLLVALVVMTTSPGPVLFRHERVGRAGTSFVCLKFRTMVVDAERILAELLAADDGLRRQFDADYKLPADPRVTRIGRWLRRTSLDELPQFWNVLRGDMSLVGPRPIVTDELERYGQWADVVFADRPGLTGLWQVSGRSDIDYDTRVALDVRYVRGRSLAGDLAIMARTAGQMVTVRRNGAH